LPVAVIELVPFRTIIRKNVVHALLCVEGRFENWMLLFADKGGRHRPKVHGRARMSFLLCLNISLQQSIKQMSDVSPATEGFSLSPASLGGGKRRVSRSLRATRKKLMKLKKQIKKMGGAEEDVAGMDQAAAGLTTAAKNIGGADLEAPAATEGGRRRRSRKTRRGRKSRRSLFGLKY
jgi:hypothetical protein